MSDKLEKFREFREKMNDKILNSGNLSIKRFFNLDSRAYETDVLDSKTKEMLGLVASMVLRCDDCITYHIIRCKEEGLSKDEFMEVFNIALVVGGSIVIPHLRRAVDLLDELDEENIKNLQKNINDQEEDTSDKEQIDFSGKIKIYTDGSCLDNPGPGGYAAVLITKQREMEVAGFKAETTNNRMELTAVIKSLRTLPVNSDVTIFSDSNYVIQGITQWLPGWKKNGWKTSQKKDVKNKDLWQTLDKLMSKYRVEFVKVKAHSGNDYNERVDSLAKEQIEKNIS